MSEVSRPRVTVYLTDKLYEDVTVISEEMGISKAEYMRNCVAQMNLAYKKTIDGIDSVAQASYRKLTEG